MVIGVIICSKIRFFILKYKFSLSARLMIAFLFMRGKMFQINSTMLTKLIMCCIKSISDSFFSNQYTHLKTYLYKIGTPV